MKEHIYYVGPFEHGNLFDTEEEALVFIEDCLMEDLINKYQNEEDVTEEEIRNELNNRYYIQEVSIIIPDSYKFFNIIRNELKEINEDREKEKEEEERRLYLSPKRKI